MNECFLIGTIVSKIEFKFVLGGHHDSIVKFQIELGNKSIVNIRAYDSAADYCYRRLSENKKILVYGNILSNSEILANMVEKI